ncbi:hypothetical protein T4A_6257 [Trichinella pseudospiralis]|uniref:Uncharacterized protein n=1 Tax=Trichinella pseudospiralis TaxID=6337 RepID=A0A0V1EIG7_TRIPS|nr:hypothetical protein T4A_6257 [Trichinella pseudospiralis]
MDLLEIITSICDGMDLFLAASQLQSEALGFKYIHHVSERLKSTLMLNHGIRRLFMVALGAGTGTTTQVFYSDTGTRNELPCKNAQAADTAVGVRDNLLCFHLVISSFREGF